MNHITVCFNIATIPAVLTIASQTHTYVTLHKGHWWV